MTEIFEMNLDRIQPSQLFISRKKLKKVLDEISSKGKQAIGIIPIKKLGGDIIFTDGHTRALASYLKGWLNISVEWETVNLDWEMYEICVDWCKENKIYTIADLESRIIKHKDYEILWYGRCKEMQKTVLEKRKPFNSEPI